MTFDELMKVGAPGLALVLSLLITGVLHLKRDCDLLVAELRKQLADAKAEADWLRGGWSRTANTIHETAAAVRREEPKP